MRGEILKGHLEMLLLALLQPGPAHGYAIIEGLRRQSDGAFDLPEGTVYPALHRLERAALREQQEEWSRFAQSIEAVLGAAQAPEPVLQEVGRHGRPD